MVAKDTRIANLGQQGVSGSAVVPNVYLWHNPQIYQAQGKILLTDIRTGTGGTAGDRYEILEAFRA